MCQTASVLRNQVKERRDRNKSQGGPPPPPEWVSLKQAGVPRKTQQLCRAGPRLT